MKFIQGHNRTQIHLFPVSLDQSIDPDNEVRIIDLQAKIDRHVAYIDNKLEEYIRALEQEDGDNKQQILDEIEKQQNRKDQYKQIEKQLKESGEAQISTSDPESRQIMIRNNITEVAYNVQTTVDAKHNIPIDYKVTNQNDSKAMGNMVQRAKSILRTNGTWYKEHNRLDNVIIFKQYKTRSCKSCPVRSQCTRSKNARVLSRSTFTEYYERNRRTLEEKEHLYKRRQAIVEHPFGTLKRQWGFSYILTKKGISRAGADVGFMFIAYNLRRIVNILTGDQMREYLRILISVFLSKTYLSRLKNSHLRTTFFRLSIWDIKFPCSLVPA